MSYTAPNVSKLVKNSKLQDDGNKPPSDSIGESAEDGEQTYLETVLRIIQEEKDAKIEHQQKEPAVAQAPDEGTSETNNLKGRHRKRTLAQRKAAAAGAGIDASSDEENEEFRQKLKIPSFQPIGAKEGELKIIVPHSRMLRLYPLCRKLVIVKLESFERQYCGFFVEVENPVLLLNSQIIGFRQCSRQC